MELHKTRYGLMNRQRTLFEQFRVPERENYRHLMLADIHEQSKQDSFQRPDDESSVYQSRASLFRPNRITLDEASEEEKKADSVGSVVSDSGNGLGPQSNIFTGKVNKTGNKLQNDDELF